jgi:dethiobiotin synthetase
MSRQFFITATGTDIGKTFMLEKLCGLQPDFDAIKPIISGFDYDDFQSDSAKILRLLKRDFNEKNLNDISPWRFTAPLSPNIAADLENKIINFSEVVDFCRKKISAAKKSNQFLYIEGAGGVMTPITNDKTFCDLMAQLKIPAILITGNYVGTISHTLTAIKALEFYKIKIAKIIINSRDYSGLEANLKTLRNLVDPAIPIETFQE